MCPATGKIEVGRILRVAGASYTIHDWRCCQAYLTKREQMMIFTKRTRYRHPPTLKDDLAYYWRRHDGAEPEPVKQVAYAACPALVYVRDLNDEVRLRPRDEVFINSADGA